MDRAEAIKILEIQLDVTSVNTPSCIKLHEALELAIEALGDAESATTTEDCISRQVVTDLLLDAQDGSGQTYEVIRELLHEVAYMPSAPVAKSATTTDFISRQQAIGEWKHTMTYYPYCSECEWMPEEDEMRHGHYDYCPNCGAKMKGDE